jgi:uncharacterized membrane protein YuzA (DUF378 family)
MNVVDWIALALVIVGALNWGLVGIAYFVDDTANWNLVNLIFDSVPEVEFAIYVLVGLASLWAIYLASRLLGVETGERTRRSDAAGGDE